MKRGLLVVFLAFLVFSFVMFNVVQAYSNCGKCDCKASCKSACKGDCKGAKSGACKCSKGNAMCTVENGLCYHFISGKPLVNGPNLIVKMNDKCKKTVVLTGNTVYYPQNLDPAKCATVNVKFLVEEGLAQAIEVMDGKSSSIIKMYDKASKTYKYHLAKKKGK